MPPLTDLSPLQQLQSANLQRPTATGDQILGYLSRQGKMAEWANQTERSLLIQSVCSVLELEVSEAELQSAGDTFRRIHGLESAAKTQAWLEQHQTSLEDWAAGIHDELLTEKLQVMLFGASVDQHYLNHRHDYDRVALSQIVVKEESLAHSLRQQLDHDPTCFCRLALEHSIRSDRDQNGGFIGVQYVKALQPEFADVIQSSQSGDILGPLQTSNGYSVLKVEKIFPTQLSPALRKEVLADLLEQWLTELRQIL